MALVKINEIDSWYRHESIDLLAPMQTYYYCTHFSKPLRIETMKDALKLKGCFVNISGLSPDNTNSVFEDIAKQIQDYEKSIAIAFFNGSTRKYIVSRNSNWKIKSSINTFPLWHLNSNIRPSKGTVKPFQNDPNRYVYVGSYEFNLLDFGTQEVDLLLDMVSGQFSGNVEIAPKVLLNNCGIPFLAPKEIKIFGGRKLNCHKVISPIINPKRTTDLLGRLVFDAISTTFFRELTQIDISIENESYKNYVDNTLKRNHIAINPEQNVQLTKVDTLGQNFVLETRNEPRLGFLGFHNSTSHEPNEPNLLNYARIDINLVPIGVWETKPLSDNKSIVRRLKMGRSNTETVNILEKEGLSLALKFPMQYSEFGSGFIFEPLKKTKLVANKGYEKLTPVTGWVKTPHPKFLLTNESGQSLSFTEHDELKYSSQPSNLVRYRNDDKLRGSNSAIPFAPEMLSGSILSQYLPQINAEALVGFKKDNEFSYGVDDIDNYVAITRAKEIRKVLPLEQAVKNSVTNTIRSSITPQSFILNETDTEQTFILAKSGDGQEVKLTIEKVDSALALDLQQPSFLIVLPQEKNAGTKFGLDAKFKIDDWAFQLAMGKNSPAEDTPDNPPEDADSETEDGKPTKPPKPIIILKYQQGKLIEFEKGALGKTPEQGMLLDSNAWTNTVSDDQGTKEIIKNWVSKISNDSGYQFLRDQVLNNPDWTGVLMINPGLDIGALPGGLKGIAAGANLKNLSAHHIGISLNRTVISETGPNIENSSFFGLIDYSDKSSINNPGVYDFKLQKLQVAFSNSEVSDFKSKMLVQLPELMDEKLSNDVIEINGQWEKITDENGQKTGDRYSFELEADLNLLDTGNDSDLLKRITLKRIEYVSDEDSTEIVDEGKSGFKINSNLIVDVDVEFGNPCLLYTSPSPRDLSTSRMPSSA